MQRRPRLASRASLAILLLAGCNVARRAATEEAGTAEYSAPVASSAAESAPASASASVAPTPPVPSPCPEGMALINKKFCIDKWEASLVAIDEQGNRTDHPHFERPQAGVLYEARSAASLLPQGYISRVEASAACKKAGKRLCSRNEWMRACQGKRGWTWPYGARGKMGKCNNGKPHLLSQLFGTQGRNWKYDDHFNSPKLNQEPGFLARSGEYAECVSPDGVFDMVGNLHEWVSDSVDDSLAEALDNENVERRRQPHRPGNGVFLGGFFSTTTEHGPGCRFITIAHEPTYHDYSTGFRCCQKSAPSPPGRGPG